jgi:predicted membrane protein
MVQPVTGEERARPSLRTQRTDRRLFGLLVLVLSTWWLLHALDAYHAPWGLWLASALVVIGVWQMCTPRRRHSHWPIAVGAVLTAALFLGNVSVNSVPAGAFGDYTFHPTALAQLRTLYAVTAGNATVDLSGLALPPGRTSFRVQEGFGNVRLIVPPHATVDLDVDIGAGRLRVAGGRNADGLAIKDHAVLQGDSASTLAIVVRVAAGNVSVERAAR